MQSKHVGPPYPSVRSRRTPHPSPRAGTPTPDFVADEDLDTVGSADAVTVAAAELCIAGIWERRDGGYMVLDHDLVDNLLSYNGRAALPHGLSRKAIDVGCRWLKALNRDRFIPL